MKKKLGFVVLFMSLLVGSIGTIASAHSVALGNSCQSGSELYGWIVDCSNHQSKTLIHFNHSLDATYQGYLDIGTTRWINTGLVSFTRDLTYSTNGNIYKYSDPNTSLQAAFHDYYSDASGHLYAWKIKYNTAKMDGYTADANKIIATHELGHAIGINDLTNSANVDKLMYGFSSRTAAYPTTADKAGATEATEK